MPSLQTYKIYIYKVLKQVHPVCPFECFRLAEPNLEYHSNSQTSQAVATLAPATPAHIPDAIKTCAGVALSSRSACQHNVCRCAALKHWHLAALLQDTGISSKAMSIMNSFINDIFEKMGSETASLARYNKKPTVTSREIQVCFIYIFLFSCSFPFSCCVPCILFLRLSLSSSSAGTVQ